MAAVLQVDGEIKTRIATIRFPTSEQSQSVEEDFSYQKQKVQPFDTTLLLSDLDDDDDDVDDEIEQQQQDENPPTFRSAQKTFQRRRRTSWTENGVINAFLAAFCNNQTICIRSFDIMLLLCQHLVRSKLITVVPIREELRKTIELLYPSDRFKNELLELTICCGGHKETWVRWAEASDAMVFDQPCGTCETDLHGGSDTHHGSLTGLTNKKNKKRKSKLFDALLSNIRQHRRLHKIANIPGLLYDDNLETWKILHLLLTGFSLISRRYIGQESSTQFFNTLLQLVAMFTTDNPEGERRSTIEESNFFQSCFGFRRFCQQIFYNQDILYKEEEDLPRITGWLQDLFPIDKHGGEWTGDFNTVAASFFKMYNPSKRTFGFDEYDINANVVLLRPGVRRQFRTRSTMTSTIYKKNEKKEATTKNNQNFRLVLQDVTLNILFLFIMLFLLFYYALA